MKISGFNLLFFFGHPIIGSFPKNHISNYSSSIFLQLNVEKP
nr:MAG TPA: hypothetical protein [Caudoviricetes sp.]